MRYEHHVHLFCSSYGADHDYQAEEDIIFTNPRIAFVASGSCSMRASNGQDLTISEGNVWFLPKQVAYRSAWQARPNVEFIFIEFDVDFLSNYYDSFFTIHAPDAEALFRATLTAWQNKDTIAVLKNLFTVLERYLPKPDINLVLPYDSVAPAISYLDAHYASPIHVEVLANACAMSKSRFYTAFKSVTGQTPIEYKNTLKINHTVRLIRQGDTLESICDKLGFASPAFLRRMVKKATGLLPREIKKNKIEM